MVLGWMEVVGERRDKVGFYFVCGKERDHV
jgi:hypothetical protein